jgi:hypothetical protein
LTGELEKIVVKSISKDNSGLMRNVEEEEDERLERKL